MASNTFLEGDKKRIGLADFFSLIEVQEISVELLRLSGLHEFTVLRKTGSSKKNCIPRFFTRTL